MVESLLQDIRYAARALRKSASYAAIAVGTLALGIGANTAIFSVVYGVLLSPLPFADPDRIVTVVRPDSTSSPAPAYGSSPANFNDFRRGARSASHVAGFSTQLVTLTGQGEPESLQAVQTVGDIFGVLGVQPLIGRALTPDDDSPASPAVAVLEHGAWQRVFGGDPAVIGRSITIGRRPRIIVGVMRPDFHFAPAPADIWLPEQWSAEYAANRDQYYIQTIARLAPGRTVEQYSAELEAIAARLRADHPQYNTDLRLAATSLQETVVAPVRTRLTVLMGAVGFLLLITCANLANLALARASVRQGEFAVRRALGAGRSRIVRQLLTESVLLATLGGVAGILVGKAMLAAIVVAEQASLPRVEECPMIPAILAFTVFVSLAAGIAVGMFPALRVSGASAMAALRQGTRGSGATSGRAQCARRRRARDRAHAADRCGAARPKLHATAGGRHRVHDRPTADDAAERRSALGADGRAEPGAHSCAAGRAGGGGDQSAARDGARVRCVAQHHRPTDPGRRDAAGGNVSGGLARVLLGDGHSTRSWPVPDP